MGNDFADRVAMVTGGASGIGRATATALRAAGATVIILDRDEGALAEATRDLGCAGEAVDVTDADAVDKAAERADALSGGIAVLVNSAGVLQRPLPPDRLSLKEWRRVVDASLAGTYTAAAAVGPRMAKRGRGAIVNVASIAGMASTPLHGYGPAKAAIVSLTQSLAAEWGPAGVRVNAVAPGFTRTPALHRAVAFSYVDEELLARQSALGRLVSAEEVAEAILFLASDRAAAITGVTLPVDAGHLAVGSWAAYGGLRQSGEGA
ncbi:MAG: SDR family NAD(P)-dependent oxidoreductase [Bauldia sp.]